MILNIGIIVDRIVLRVAPTIEKRQKESIASSRSTAFSTLASTPPSPGSVWASASRGLLLLQSLFTIQDCPNFGGPLSSDTRQIAKANQKVGLLHLTWCL